MPWNVPVPNLPAAVRWLPAGAAPGPCEGWPGLPGEAAGAIVFAFTRGSCPDPAAISLEALTGDGARMADRWRRTIGKKTGALFDAGGAGPATVLAEGEVSALACRWLHPGARCLATGGSSGLAAIQPAMLAAGRPILIEADGDKPGRNAAREARDRLPGATVTWRSSDDPADDLAAYIGERAAIIGEAVPADEALAAAWHDLLI